MSGHADKNGVSGQRANGANGPGQRDHTKKMPVFIWEYAKGQLFYGIPGNQAGHSLKLGWHHDGRPIDPDGLTQHVQKPYS